VTQAGLAAAVVLAGTEYPSGKVSKGASCTVHTAFYLCGWNPWRPWEVNCEIVEVCTYQGLMRGAGFRLVCAGSFVHVPAGVM
jgi:hypothetical protein